MPVAAYGATNPAGTDPWPIESVLAKEALSGNSSAHAMLADYRMAREADTNLYNQSMEGQHAFAKQQLADEMTRARITAIPQYLAHGQAGAELVTPGAGLGLGDAINPDAAARSLQASRAADFAKNLDLTGKGIESLSRAGQDVALQQIPGYTNLQTTGQGEHSDISVEKIKAATALQTAAMHAAAKGAAGPSAGSFSTQLDVGPETNNRAYSARSYKNEPLEHFVDRTTPANKRPVKPPGVQSTAQTDPGGARGRDNARGATRNVAPAGRVANAAPGADAVQRQYQTYVETKLRTQNPAAYADIMAQAQRNGGAVQLGRDAKGTFIQGARGTYQ